MVRNHGRILSTSIHRTYRPHRKRKARDALKMVAEGLKGRPAMSASTAPNAEKYPAFYRSNSATRSKI